MIGGQDRCSDVKINVMVSRKIARGH